VVPVPIKTIHVVILAEFIIQRNELVWPTAEFRLGKNRKCWLLCWKTQSEMLGYWSLDSFPAFI